MLVYQLSVAAITTGPFSSVTIDAVQRTAQHEKRSLTMSYFFSSLAVCHARAREILPVGPERAEARCILSLPE